MDINREVTCTCGNKSYRIIKRINKKEKDFLLIECKACNLISTFPMPTQTIGGKEYHQNKLENIKLWETFAVRLIKIVETYRNKKDTKILEIGSNIGVFLKVAKENGWDAEGIDIDRDAVKVAKEKFGLAIKEGDISNISLSKESFDVVVMAHVLEHVFDLNNLLVRIKDLLKVGGILVIEVPNIDGLPVKIQNLRGEEWYGYDPERHVWHFNPENITKLLERNGFSVDKLLADTPMHYGDSENISDFFRRIVLKISSVTKMADQIIVVAKPEK